MLICSIFQMDDDIYVNLPQFLSAARRNIPAGSSLWMLGLLQVQDIQKHYQSIDYVRCLMIFEHLVNYIKGKNSNMLFQY